MIETPLKIPKIDIRIKPIKIKISKKKIMIKPVNFKFSDPKKGEDKGRVLKRIEVLNKDDLT